MRAMVYRLPEISFVGGETRDILFRLKTETGRVFNATGVTATFSVVDSVHRTGAPYISKEMRVLADDNGINSVLFITLLPKETKDMSGKYIYQITMRDMGGETEIPSQGILDVINNIDKAIIT